MSPRPARVLVALLVRRRGASVVFTQAHRAPPPAPIRRPAKIARLLALAHHVQRAIDAGAFSDRAAVARALGLTPARITQLLDLLLLAPDLQEAVLHLEAVDGAEPLTERRLRDIVKLRTWSTQRALSALIPATDPAAPPSMTEPFLHAHRLPAISSMADR